MDANDVNQVVDKVAEKLGMAVEKVAPLCEQVIREFQMVSIMQAVGCFLMAAAVLVAGRQLSRWCARERNEDDNAGEWGAALFITRVGSWVACFILVGVGVFTFIPRALAPTYYCLKELL